MEMSLDYMRETVAFMRAHGWAHQREERTMADEPGALQRREVHELRRPDGAHLRLEGLAYEDGSERYYLTLLEFSGLSSPSYRVESWRHRDGRIEFKYYEEHRTGEGLSFVVELDTEI